MGRFLQVEGTSHTLSSMAVLKRRAKGVLTNFRILLRHFLLVLPDIVMIVVSLPAISVRLSECRRRSGLSLAENRSVLIGTGVIVVLGFVGRGEVGSFLAVQGSVRNSAIAISHKTAAHSVLTNLRLGIRDALGSVPVWSVGRTLSVLRDLVALVRRKLRAHVVRLFSHFVFIRRGVSIGRGLEADVSYVLDESRLRSVLSS